MVEVLEDRCLLASDVFAITFANDSSGLSQINSDGTEQQQIGGIKVTGVPHEWSIDGSRLTYNRDNQVWIIEQELTTERTIAAGLDPTWSPNGSEVAFVSLSGGIGQAGTDILIANHDGSNARRIDLGEFGVGDYGISHRPDWSPDGEKFAYIGVSVHDVFGFPLGTLNTVNVDGTNKQILVDIVFGADFVETVTVDAKWSPDSSRLAFTRVTQSDSSGSNQRSEVWIVNQDGSGLSKLADGHSAFWSPDGGSIVFVGNQPDTGPESDLLMMNADGSNVRVILADTVTEFPTVRHPQSELTIKIEPANVLVGEKFTVTVTGTNRLRETVTNITPPAELTIAGDGAATLVSGPVPVVIESLAPDESAEVVYEYMATVIGSLVFGVQVTGNSSAGPFTLEIPSTCSAPSSDPAASAGLVAEGEAQEEPCTGPNTLEILKAEISVNSVSDLPLRPPTEDEDETSVCDTGSEDFTIDGEQAVECTLRAAIQFANVKDPGVAVSIVFDIPDAVDTQTIDVGVDGGEPLPIITHSLEVDATTQTGFVDKPIIELNGANVPTGDGFSISGVGATIRGFVINGFEQGAGIRIENSTGSVIQGNRIGTNAEADSSVPNGAGIILIDVVDALIGGRNTPQNEEACSADCNIISGNNDSGVKFLEITSKLNKLTGNFIGVDASGTSALPNANSGVFIDEATNNQVGGPFRLNEGDICNGECNVISGNEGDAGVRIDRAKKNSVAGNFIGTDVNGSTAIPNPTGVSLMTSDETEIGGLTETPGLGRGNVISGNRNAGVRIEMASLENSVRGNIIGPDVTGTKTVPRGIAKNGSEHLQSSGVLITDEGSISNVIGGSSSDARNLIAGNFEGVSLLDVGDVGDGNVANRVQGNFIGTDINGTSVLSNQSSGVQIDNGSVRNLIGAATVTPGEAPGNVISGNSSNGISLAGDYNQVAGNLIGPNRTGSDLLPLTVDENGNSESVQDIGIDIRGTGNLIGGDSPTSRNIIAGHTALQTGSEIVFHPAGIQLTEATSTQNKIRGNFIGTDASGSFSLANDTGIRIFGGPSENLVEANLLSGNISGIHIINATEANLVQGNQIGIDESGLVPIGNEFGIIISDSRHQVIGGTRPVGNSASCDSPCNLIAFNDIGIIVNDDNNEIRGNFIGVGRDGTTALPNERGISVERSSGNVIGGASNAHLGICDQDCNVISGNEIYGISLAEMKSFDSGPDFLRSGFSASNTVVSGNFIGVGADLSPAGNGGNGVLIGDGDENLIGGITPSQGNRIAFNGGAGVLAASSIQFGDDPRTGPFTFGIGNTIRNNRIHDNNRLGIDISRKALLSGDGVTPNSIHPPGPNDLNNFPVLLFAQRNGSEVSVAGRVDDIPTVFRPFTIDLYANSESDSSGHGEGQIPIATTTVSTLDSQQFRALIPALAVSLGHITATSTNSDGSTSEFSFAISVVNGSDSDLDGRLDDVEDLAANNGDGNADGTLDSNQNTVASLPARAQNFPMTTLALANGSAFANVSAVENPSPTDGPDATSFPLGFFEFEVIEVEVGGRETVEIFPPPDYQFDTYWRYGPTPDDPTDHWYEFLYDGNVGAEILDDRVLLHLVDGELGDDDLTANGTIVDAGAPANSFPWQNDLNRLDANGRDGVAPIDALVVINYINANPVSSALPALPATPPPYYDVNGDNVVTAIDVLLVVNSLNNRQVFLEPEQFIFLPDKTVHSHHLSSLADSSAANPRYPFDDEPANRQDAVITPPLVANQPNFPARSLPLRLGSQSVADDLLESVLDDVTNELAEVWSNFRG